MKPIRLSEHAKRRLQARGFTEDEVRETILTSEWQPAELNRLECRKTYPYGKTWNGRQYQYKQVRPIFLEEDEEIVVIAVYTYFFNEEVKQ